MKTLKELEYEAIAARIKHFGGSKDQAAKSLGISRSRMYRYCVVHPELHTVAKEMRTLGLRESLPVETQIAKQPEITLPMGQR